jgi:hypothetical protein
MHHRRNNLRQILSCNNGWIATYGMARDDEMTAAALGLHEKLKKSGDVAVGSEEYYAILDKTIRQALPREF